MAAHSGSKLVPIVRVELDPIAVSIGRHFECTDAAADNGLDVRTVELLGKSFERVLSEVGNAHADIVSYAVPDAPAELEALGVQHALADA